MVAADRDGDAALREVADRLYGGQAAAFTSARADAARSARADGDRDLAARISALPKPSAAAALLNALAHHAPDALQQVLDLGDAVREAQESGDRERLRKLGADRRRLLAAVAEQAAGIVERRPGDAVLDEVQGSLQVALTSDQAAEAVRSGRLVRGLAVDAFDDDLTGVAAGGSSPARHPSPSRRGSGEDDGRGAAARAAAQQAFEEAERRADALRRAADARALTAERARAAARQADALVADRRTELDRALRLLDDAERQAAEARRRAAEADRELNAATEQADEAEATARAARHS